MFSLLSHSAGF